MAAVDRFPRHFETLSPPKHRYEVRSEKSGKQCPVVLRISFGVVVAGAVEVHSGLLTVLILSPGTVRVIPSAGSLTRAKDSDSVLFGCEGCTDVRRELVPSQTSLLGL